MKEVMKFDIKTDKDGRIEKFNVIDSNGNSLDHSIIDLTITGNVEDPSHLNVTLTTEAFAELHGDILTDHIKKLHCSKCGHLIICIHCGSNLSDKIIYHK